MSITVPLKSSHPSCLCNLVALLCAWQVPEHKGLDIVRRDWSPLSKDIGNFCLQQILSGQ